MAIRWNLYIIFKYELAGYTVTLENAPVISV